MGESEERIKILQMLQDGVITAEEAAGLLEALNEADASKTMAGAYAQLGATESKGPAPRWMRVQVTDTDTGKSRVNVRLPIAMIKAGSKFGMRFVPEVEGMDLADLFQFIENGELGKVVDVYDDEDGEHVEVFLE